LAVAEGNNATNYNDDSENSVGEHDICVHIEVVSNIAQDLHDGRVLFQRVFFE
jgi:regulator of sigma D